MNGAQFSWHQVFAVEAKISECRIAKRGHQNPLQQKGKGMKLHARHEISGFRSFH